MWFDYLCYMWESDPRGKITGTKESLMRLIGCTTEEFENFISENNQFKFADVTFRNNFVTVINRRMYRSWLEKEKTRIRVKEHRDKHKKQECNENVQPEKGTPSSSSSFSSSINNKSSINQSTHTPQKTLFAKAAESTAFQACDCSIISDTGEPSKHVHSIIKELSPLSNTGIDPDTIDKAIITNLCKKMKTGTMYCPSNNQANRCAMFLDKTVSAILEACKNKKPEQLVPYFIGALKKRREAYLEELKPKRGDLS